MKDWGGLVFLLLLLALGAVSAAIVQCARTLIRAAGG